MTLWKEAREFKSWAEDYGWVFEGFAQNGHMIFTHETGGRVQVSATPSGYQTRENEKRRMLRKCGASESKPKAGKSRYKPMVGFTSTHGTPASPDAPWVRARDELERVDERLVRLGRDHPDAVYLAGLRMELAAKLERFCQPVPPLPKVFE